MFSQLEASIFPALVVRFATCCSWLRCFAAARHKCLICGEREPKKPKETENFVYCSNPKCNFVYCFECWKGVKQICFACASPDQSEDDHDDGYYYDRNEE
jgi:hypothetical protein